MNHGADTHLLVDLGYASLERLRECERFGIKLVLRLAPHAVQGAKTYAL